MKIFVIDDDQFSIHVTETLLLMEGAALEVRSFLYAEDALRELQTEKRTVPDLIFLDLNMPVMDGWGFLEALSSIAMGKCGVYILTSSLDLSDFLKSKDYPLVLGFIHKPIKEEDIQVAIAHRNSLQF